MIAVVDYESGNLFSIGQALHHLGADYEITADPDRIAGAERIILPGVGAFGDAMARLCERGFADLVRDEAIKGTPLLGICVGMQLLADRSEEFGEHEGLGLIPGIVQRLPDGDGASGTIRIPNVGWRWLRAKPGEPFLDGLATETMVYFVHSYAMEAADPNHVIAAVDVNHTQAAAVVRKDNIVGYQFHPEKSGTAGLALLQRFLRLERGAHRATRAMVG